jgi:hypothetical protein
MSCGWSALNDQGVIWRMGTDLHMPMLIEGLQLSTRAPVNHIVANGVLLNVYMIVFELVSVAVFKFHYLAGVALHVSLTLKLAACHKTTNTIRTETNKKVHGLTLCALVRF